MRRDAYSQVFPTRRFAGEAAAAYQVCVPHVHNTSANKGHDTEDVLATASTYRLFFLFFLFFFSPSVIKPFIYLPYLVLYFPSLSLWDN